MARVRKITLKDILSVVLTIAAIVAACAVVVSISKDKTKTISSTAFARGAIDSNGEFCESETQLYTKEMFECQGLTVTLDFEAKLEYEVFYYAEKDSYIGSTGTLTKDYSKDDTFPEARYARIVLTPELKEGEDKIHFWEILEYAKNVEISVNKKQSFEPPAEETTSDSAE